ncbi:MAG: hypothetical protein CK425_03440 [Parachlamydia sp.]|nr:MAG: hypothetical protein CK425_03440 [Parachlamydia sp.]
MHFDGNFDNYINLANYYDTLSLVSEPDTELKDELNSASDKVRVTVKNCEKQPDYLKQQFQKIQQIHSEEHKKIYVLDFLKGLNMTVKELESKDCPGLIEIFLKQIEGLAKSAQAQPQLPAILPSPTKPCNVPLTSPGTSPSIPPPPAPPPFNGSVTPRVKIIPSAEPTPATTTPKLKPGMQKGFSFDTAELLAAHKKIKGNTPLTEKRNDTPRRPAPQTSMQNPASSSTPSTPKGNGTIHPGNEDPRTPLTPAGNTSQGTPLPRTPYRVSNQGPKTTNEVETPTTPITFNGKVVKTRERSFLKKGKTVGGGDPKSPSKKAQKEIEEAGVDVKKIIARLEALFKESLENNKKTVDRLLDNILKPENNPMLKKFLDSKPDSGHEEILGKITPVFKEVAAEVVSDFNACWITKKEFSQFSEEEANALLLTPDKLLRKVPEGMSISILLRDAWLFRSYARCLDLNYQRHLATKQGKATPDTEVIEVALNLFKYFFTHLEEIEQIEIYAEAGKTIRGKEMQIVELINGNVSKEMKEHYIEKGGRALSCSESFFGTRRVDQPEEDKLPNWLKSNLS